MNWNLKLIHKFYKTKEYVLLITDVEDTVTYKDIWTRCKSTCLDPSVISLDSNLPEGARPDFFIVVMKEIERLNDIIYIGRPAFTSNQSSVELCKLVEGSKFAIRTRIGIESSSFSMIEIL